MRFSYVRTSVQNAEYVYGINYCSVFFYMSRVCSGYIWIFALRNFSLHWRVVVPRVLALKSRREIRNTGAIAAWSFHIRAVTSQSHARMRSIHLTNVAPTTQHNLFPSSKATSFVHTLQWQMVPNKETVRRTLVGRDLVNCNCQFSPSIRRKQIRDK